MAKDTPKHPSQKTIGWALLQASRLHRTRVGEQLSGLGLFAGQEQVLQALRVTQTASMSDLASMLRVQPPTLTRTISKLEASGLVEKSGGPGDGRRVHVALTAAGVDKAAALDAIEDGIEREMVKGFDTRERRRLRKLLRRAARNLAEANGQDPRDLETEDDEAAA